MGCVLPHDGNGSPMLMEILPVSDAPDDRRSFWWSATRPMEAVIRSLEDKEACSWSELLFPLRDCIFHVLRQLDNDVGLESLRRSERWYLRTSGTAVRRLVGVFHLWHCLGGRPSNGLSFSPTVMLGSSWPLTVGVRMVGGCLRCLFVEDLCLSKGRR